MFTKLVTMAAEDSSAQRPPKAFFSYSWDNAEHRQWVADLGARLRADGVELLLDEWHVRPGDQLPHFMEAAAPSWLLGKFYLDFRGNPYSEASYYQLLDTLHDLLPRAPVVRHGESSSGQRFSPEAVTRQTKYVEFVNAAMRVFYIANKKFVLYKNGSRPAQVLMGEVQEELQRAAGTVHELMNEIFMFSSEPVKKAAGEIAGWILGAQAASMLPALEGEFKDIHGKFAREAVPKFREAVRLEAGLR